MVCRSEVGASARDGAGDCADRAAQAHLSLPLCAEGGAARRFGESAARDACVRGGGGHLASQPCGGRGRGAPDVGAPGTATETILLSLLRCPVVSAQPSTSFQRRQYSRNERSHFIGPSLLCRA